VEAKNGDELFREEDKFHAGNGKTQACSQVALPLLILGLVGLGGGGRGEKGGFLSFYVPHSSQCLHTMFPSSSQYVPRHVLHSTSILSHICIGKCCPPFTHIDGPKGKDIIFTLQDIILCFGEASIDHCFFSE
jgi:hypothetical protein